MLGVLTVSKKTKIYFQAWSELHPSPAGRSCIPNHYCSKVCIVSIFIIVIIVNISIVINVIVNLVIVIIVFIRIL